MLTESDSPPQFTVEYRHDNNTRHCLPSAMCQLPSNVYVRRDSDLSFRGRTPLGSTLVIIWRSSKPSSSRLPVVAPLTQSPESVYSSVYDYIPNVGRCPWPLAWRPHML
eukprot:6213027-Pleurochrysis_carterae.AAC.3